MRLFDFLWSVCDLIYGATCKSSGLAIIAALVFTPIVIPYFYGHDWQRLFQLGVALFMLAFLLRASRIPMQLAFPSEGQWVLTLVVVLALISSLLCDKSYWAFCEISLAFACCTIALGAAHARRQAGASLDRKFVCFVIALCVIKILQFSVSVLAGYVTSTGTLDLDLLVEGFSNRRFYGQFQTLTLPLLALPLLLSGIKRSLRHLIFVLLTCWWLIAIVGGTRGTWLGIAVAAAAMSLCGPTGFMWVRWQAMAILAGLVLYMLFFSVLPDFLGVELVNSAGGRLTTTLSARDIIWQQAWDMIKAQPFLGFGPMHFADIYNPVAAHPHQAILQWASEWGVPSTVLVGWLVIRGVWVTFMQIRKRVQSDDLADLLRICLFASLIGSLTQAMVDGVIVMPYSQLWLAIVVGWLMGIHEWADVVSGRSLLRKGWMVMTVLAVGFLVYAVAHDFPNREERKTQFGRDFGGFYQPRFWQQGVIATKPQ